MERFAPPSAGDEYALCVSCSRRLHYSCLDEHGFCGDCNLLCFCAQCGKQVRETQLDRHNRCRDCQWEYKNSHEKL